MHVCFIYIRNYKYYVSGLRKHSITDYNQISLGISYISSMLKQNGHTTELLFYSSYDKNLKKILNKIEKEPQVFAITIVTDGEYDMAMQIIQLIKQYYKTAKIIVGGAHVTIFPEQIVENVNVDALCIGEGEFAISQYVKQVEKGEYKKTDNLWIKNGKEIIKCDRSVFIQNIDELPFPDRQIWDRWATRPDNQSVLLMRGCKNRCKYCGNYILSTKSEGQYVRYRNINSVVKEIKQIKQIYKDLEIITFYVENALADINYFCDLCNALSELNDSLSVKIKFDLYLNFTPNLLEKDIYVIDLMKKANICFVKFALESGSLDIRKKLNRPYYTNEQFIKFCNILRQNKIYITILAMYCFPYETKESYLETVNCVRQCKPNLLNYTWLTMKETENIKKIPFVDLYRYFIFRWLVMISYKNLTETIFFTIAPYKIFNPISKLLTEFVSCRNKINDKYKLLAKKEFDELNFKKAIKYFNKIKINEYNYWIYGDRAIAKMNIGDYHGAIKDFNKILELDPKEIYEQKKQECLNLLNKKAS